MGPMAGTGGGEHRPQTALGLAPSCPSVGTSLSLTWPSSFLGLGVPLRGAHGFPWDLGLGCVALLACEM